MYILLTLSIMMAGGGNGMLSSQPLPEVKVSGVKGDEARRPVSSVMVYDLSFEEGRYTGPIESATGPLPQPVKHMEVEAIHVPMRPLPADETGIMKSDPKWRYNEDQNKTISTTITRSFSGISYTGYYPPDVQVAAGSGGYVGEVVNSSITFYDSTGSALYSASLSSFFSSLSLPSGILLFDPKIAYDPIDDRWIVLVLGMKTSTSESYYYLAVSTSSNPFGTWHYYSLDATIDGSSSSSNWADYPGLGFNNWGIFITSNQYDWTTGSFSYAKMRILDKAAAYNGTLSTWYDIWNQPYTSSWKVAQSMSSCDTAYVLRTYWNGGTYYMRGWKVTGSSSSPTLSARYDISIQTYNNPSDAVQQGGSNPIDVGDCRIQDVTYYNGVLMASFTEENPTYSGLSAIRYVSLNPTTMTVINDITYGSTYSSYFYPRVAPSSNGVVMVFGRCSSTEYAGVAYTYKDYSASAFEASSWVQNGLSYYELLDGSGRNRWGDYFGAHMDPDNPQRVWIAGEYAYSTSQWATHIALITTSPATSPDLAIDSLSFSDNTYGDGDSVLEGGERIYFKIQLRNTGSDTATDVNGVISTSDSYIVIYDSSSTWDDLPPSTSKWSDLFFSFYIPYYSPTHDAMFYLNITSSEGTWVDSFPVHVVNQLPDSPTGVVAGDGFRMCVPLTWNISANYSTFRIYRSTVSGGPYTLIDSVDVSGRNYFDNEDYIDTNVTAGTMYYYVIVSVVDSTESPYSAEVSATPTTEGTIYHSNFTHTPPTIDGVISPGEWSDASNYSAEVSGLGLLPIAVMFKNDSNYLYIAVVNSNDTTNSFVDEVGIYFDLNKDDTWASDTTEGNLWITDGSYATFRGITGDYPDNLDFMGASAADSIVFATSQTTTGLTFEIRLDLMNSPFRLNPGDTTNIWMYIYDGDSLLQSFYYPGLGYLKFGSVWTAPRSYSWFVLDDGVIPPPSDTFRLIDAIGAPGTSVHVRAQLVHQEPISGIQATFSYDSSLLSLNDVSLDSSLSTFSITYNDFGDSVKVMIVSLSGDSILPGTQHIFDLVFDIDSSATIGDSTPISFEDYALADPFSHHISAVTEDAWVRVLGMKGDLNQDGVVDVSDVVREINIILGRPPAPTSYELWAADINDDGSVDVADVVATINIALGTVATASFEPAEATLTAENNSVRLESNGRIAGIQFDLLGDVSDVRLSNGLNGMELFTNEIEGGIRVLIVSLDGMSLENFNGQVVSFDGQAILANPVISDERGQKLDTGQNDIPKSLALLPVYPNPVSGRNATVKFELPRRSFVRLALYDATGRAVQVLVSGEFNAGRHEIALNTAGLASGVYFLNMRTSEKSLTRKIVIR